MRSPDSSSAGTSLKRFDFTTGRYRLRTSGMVSAIEPAAWTGPAVARAVDAALGEAVGRGVGGPVPMVVGVIPFDPSSPAQLHIPERVERTDAGAASWDVALYPDDAPAPTGLTPTLRGLESPHYRAAVSSALDRIERGDLQKVVLGRCLTAQVDEPIDLEALHGRLASQNPAAFTFRLDLDGGQSLLGASPELVLSSWRGQVETHPLAGSAPRVDDDRTDIAIGRTLLDSPKDRAEHAHVTRAVGAVMRAHALDVVEPAAPSLVRTPVIWHLGTRITGRLRPGMSALELAYAMHPTPAVSGWPVAAARSAIAELEGFDRGVFAGLIGWTDVHGTGEWALVLRCGLVRDRTATMFAGAGIVAGSDPEAEHHETGVKLTTFVEALGSVPVSASRA